MQAFNELPYFYSGDGLNPAVKSGVGFFYFKAGAGRIIVNLSAGQSKDVEVVSIFVGETQVIGDPMACHKFPTLEFCCQEFNRLESLNQSS